MSTSDRSYVYADALKRRFTQDIADAAQASRITEQEQQRLRLLIDVPYPAHNPTARPRVDRLLAAEGEPLSVELAAALLITDAPPRVFLSTLAHGIEAFDSRLDLLTSLERRFAIASSAALALNATLVEGDIFHDRALSIIDQKARRLTELTQQLNRLPNLHQGLGRALQTRVDAIAQDESPDVFSHRAQIIRASTDQVLSPVVGTQSLVDAAMQVYARVPLGGDLQLQFLDSQGRILLGDKAGLYHRALSEVGGDLEQVFENLLGHYWETAVADARSPREMAIQTFAEGFHDEVLAQRNQATLAEVEFAWLASLLKDDPLPTSSAILLYRLAVSAQASEPVKLAGVFLIDLAVARYPGLILYSACHGLRRFNTLADVAAYFATAAGRIELDAYLSLNDREVLKGSTSLRLRVDIIDRPLFSDRVDSIIAFQKRNVAFVITSPTTLRSAASVMVEDALDVRDLIEPRLKGLAVAGRWALTAEESEQTWAPLITPHVYPVTGALTVALDQVLPAWALHLKDLQDQIDLIGTLYPGIKSSARSVLNRYLAMFGSLARDAHYLWVHEPDEEPVNLIVLFLELLTGHRQAVHKRSRVYWTAADGRNKELVTGLTGSLLNSLLERARDGFDQTYARQIRQFHAGPLRRGNVQLMPTQLGAWVRERLLWVHLDTAQRVGTISSDSLAMFKQVLGRPTLSLRTATGDEMTQVYSMTVLYDANRPAAQMTNIFVMRQPLMPDGKLLMWSPLKGLSEHASMHDLELYLSARLAYPGSRAIWLDLFADRDRQLIDAALRASDAHRLTVNLVQINGHFIEHLHAAELERQCKAIEQTCENAMRWQASAPLTIRLIESVQAEDRSRLTLDALSRALDVSLFMAVAPGWVLQAPTADLYTLHLLIVRFYATYDPQRSFALSIPNLPQFAQEKIQAKLDADFPGKHLDPEKITISLTRYTGTPGGIGDIPSSIPASTLITSGTLTQFAITRFAGGQDATLSIDLGNQDAGTVALEPLYIRELVRDLDIGDQYRSLLKEKLSEHDPDYARRLQYFSEQTPPLLSLTAFQYKMEKKLSQTAYAFIENVFSMPDGLARQPLEGRDIILSPLQLVAGEGGPPHEVKGVYLITPRKTDEGPWLLYAIFDENIDLLEYANETAFLDALHDSSILQTFILGRLDPLVRPIYDNGGFVEPHLPWSTESTFDFPPSTPLPVTVKIEPVESNVLHYLFKGTGQILQLAAHELSLTTAESDKQASRFLMTLGTEQILALLPGRLGLLVGLWQSKALLGASLSAAGHGRWGKALSEFFAALSLWISARRAPEEIVFDVVHGGGETNIEVVEPAPFPEFSWNSSSLSPELQTRLREFEARTVSLSELQKDSMSNTYKDTKTSRDFAAVAGKVYEVRFGHDGWRIVDHEIQGPFIKLDSNQQWKLNLEGGLKGGGGLVTKVQRTLVDYSVDDIFITEASGLKEIRQNFRDRARRIGEAHLQAKIYLQTSLSNLEPGFDGGPPHPQTTKIIAEFFGGQGHDPLLLATVRKSISDVLNELLSPSLSPFSSKRFVVGTNRAGSGNISAFIFPHDPGRRVFLTERFFFPRTVRLKRAGLGQITFNQDAHYRAATLVHELSHLSGDTHDIAYVDATAPYLDLLEDTGAYRTGLKRSQEKQQRCLSHMTPRDELFTETHSGEPRDLKHGDGSGKQQVLDITDKKTLDEARDVFLADAEKRRDIILSNADSVALLVTLLGRKLFVMPKD